jgi:AraC-like DNA-binding protein
VDVMADVLGRQTIDAEIASPAFADARLSEALAQLFRRIDRWNERPRGGGDSASVRTTVPSRGLALVRERLDEASAPAPSLAELANIAGLSRYQVLRRFEKVYGVPPHAWLLGRRAERARLLIRRGQTLASVAAGCGFADQSHMTRAFVRHFGFTPGPWRRAFFPQ